MDSSSADVGDAGTTTLRREPGRPSGAEALIEEALQHQRGQRPLR